MKKSYLLLGLPVLAVVLFGAGCEGTGAVEQAAVNDNMQKMVNAVPIPQLTNSLERTNIAKRLSTFDDPNKVSYIYLINYGKVMSFYTIKGKVTSGSKRLTSTQRFMDDCGNTIQSDGTFPCSGITTTDAPELDGTYGSSNPYIFFWTTDGVYVQWSGDYMLVDQPLQLSTPPEMVRNIK